MEMVGYHGAQLSQNNTKQKHNSCTEKLKKLVEQAKSHMLA
jgi:hypothetical protein